MTVSIQASIYSDVADLLVSQPSLEDLANFRFAEPIQRYIENLLEKNREGELSADEKLELEHILAINHVISLTKAKAKLKLVNKA